MGKPYKRASDGLWAQQIELPPKPDGSRRRKYVYAATKSELASKVRAATRELDVMGDMLTASPSLAKWLDYWLKDIVAPRLRPKTVANYTHMASLIKPPLGKVKVDKLTPAHVRRLEAYVVGDKGLSSTTAHNAHAVLRKALADAMTEGVVSRNVASLVPAPEVAHYEAKYLTAEQGGELLLSVASDPRAAIRWSLALFMGMRQGECLGLRVDHVDVEAGEITVEWQLQQLSVAPRKGSKHEDLGGGYYLTPPKTGAGERVLPMPEHLTEMMRRYLPTLPGPESFVCGPGIVDDRTDERAWKRALKNAGLPEVRLHSARHTALTLLARLGAADHVRQAVAGHASAKVLRKYTHADRDEVRGFMDQLGSTLVRQIEG